MTTALGYSALRSSIQLGLHGPGFEANVTCPGSCSCRKKFIGTWEVSDNNDRIFYRLIILQFAKSLPLNEFLTSVSLQALGGKIEFS